MYNPAPRSMSGARGLKQMRRPTGQRISSLAII